MRGGTLRRTRPSLSASIFTTGSHMSGRIRTATAVPSGLSRRLFSVSSAPTLARFRAAAIAPAPHVSSGSKSAVQLGVTLGVEGRGGKNLRHVGQPLRLRCRVFVER